MSRRTFANFIVAVLGFASVACSGQSPVSPAKRSASPAGVGGVSVLGARDVPGTYELAFFKSGLVPVSSLPFGQELILGAHVEDSSGLPAQRGAVTFEYCSLKGGPSNDITRVDEAPSEACANGSGTWARLLTMEVNGSGNAYMNFGIVRITPVIGFRFRYNGQGSGIASGVSAPKDFFWVSLP